MYPCQPSVNSQPLSKFLDALTADFELPVVAVPPQEASIHTQLAQMRVVYGREEKRREAIKREERIEAVIRWMRD